MVDRNLCANPAAGANLDGWSVAVASGGTFNPTRVTSGLSGSWDRATAARVTAPSSPGAWTQIISAGAEPGGSIAGRTFTVTGQWSASSSPSGGLYAFAAFVNASNVDVGYVGNDVTFPVTAGAVTRRTVVATAPAGAVGVQFRVYAAGATSGWQATVSAVRIDEVNNPSMPYRDGGDTGLGWSWDGTANNSTSTGPPDAPPSSLWPWICELLNQPPTLAPVRHDLSGKPDGPLTVADTGQPWSTTTAGTNPITPEIRSGAISPPAAWTAPGADTNGVSAGYAYLPFPGPVTWIGATVRWDTTATSSPAGGGCLASCNTFGYQGAASSCPIHLSFGWNFVEFAVFVDGIENFAPLTPIGGGGSNVTLAAPMIRDGATETRIDVWIDRAASKAWVTAGANPVLVYSDARIGATVTSWAFWQHYLPAGSVNRPRYTRVWASSVH